MEECREEDVKYQRTCAGTLVTGAIVWTHTGCALNALKNTSIEEIIQNFQYINRLMGYYEEHEIPILYCVSGAMPAVTPPSLMIAPEIIEVLIAAEQGVKHIQLNNWLQGNIAQDLAYILTLKKLAAEYLRTFGYIDVETTTYSASPTGRFPEEHERVFALIAYYTMIGLLGRVQMIGSRTIDEAHHIPTKEGTVLSFKCAQMMAGILQTQGLNILENESVKAAWEESELRPNPPCTTMAGDAEGQTEEDRQKSASPSFFQRKEEEEAVGIFFSFDFFYIFL